MLLSTFSFAGGSSMQLMGLLGGETGYLPAESAWAASLECGSQLGR